MTHSGHSAGAAARALIFLFNAMIIPWPRCPGTGCAVGGVAMRVLTISAVITLALISHGARAGCSPPEIAHLGAMLNQEDRLMTRVGAGECSLIPEMNRLLVITRGIIRQDMVTRGCYGYFKKLKPLARCGCTEADHIYACNGTTEAGNALGAPTNRPTQPDQVTSAPPSSASKTSPAPSTVPAPTAGQSRQQTAVARRSEESRIFQSSSSFEQQQLEQQ